MYTVRVLLLKLCHSLFHIILCPFQHIKLKILKIFYYVSILTLSGPSDSGVCWVFIVLFRLGKSTLKESSIAKSKIEQQPSWPSERQASLGEVGEEDGAEPERRIVRIVLKCNQRFTFTPS